MMYTAAYLCTLVYINVYQFILLFTDVFWCIMVYMHSCILVWALMVYTGVGPAGVNQCGPLWCKLVWAQLVYTSVCLTGVYWCGPCWCVLVWALLVYTGMGPTGVQGNWIYASWTGHTLVQEQEEDYSEKKRGKLIKYKDYMHEVQDYVKLQQVQKEQE